MSPAKLPSCRHRGQRRQPGVYDCHSTKFIGLKLVTATACGQCAVRDHPPEADVPAQPRHLLPCAHFGSASATGSAEVHRCSHPDHGPTTTWAACQQCPGYLFPLFTKTLPQSMVRRLIALGPRDQLDGWWLLPNVQEAYRHLARQFLRQLAAYPGGCAGKGIVLAGGGTYLPSAYVTVRVLRHVGCKLPIELWHLKGEVNDRARELLARYDVTSVNADLMVREKPFPFLKDHWWKGWQLKPYAIAHSRFQEVLYLDADCYPTRDPTSLFSCRPYRAHGALFWPDLADSWSLLNPAVGKIFGARPKEPPLESGQMLINKKACWSELQLALWYNGHAAYVYRHLWGDKDTFNIAWQVLGREYGMLYPRAGWDKHTILQYDAHGRVLFQHRCRDKFRLRQEAFPTNPQVPGDNVFNPNLVHEKECFQFLEDLRRQLASRERQARKTYHR
jgi:hypothetical protein